VLQSICGIGLNVNQEIFPPEIPNPVSMKLVTGQTYSVDECRIVSRSGQSRQPERIHHQATGRRSRAGLQSNDENSAAAADLR